MEQKITVDTVSARDPAYLNQSHDGIYIVVETESAGFTVALV